MEKGKVLDNIQVLSKLFEKYDELKEYVLESQLFDEALEEMVQNILSTNDKFSFMDMECEKDSIMKLGYCKLEQQIPDFIQGKVEKQVPGLVKGGLIEVPIVLDDKEDFSISFLVEKQTENVEFLIEKIVMHMLKKRHSMNIRCIDLVSGGSFFMNLYELVYGIKSISGGQIYSDMKTVQDCIDEIEKIAERNMIAVGNRYTSFVDYNEKNKDKLSECTVIMYMKDIQLSKEYMKKISNLISSRKRNGLNIILVGNDNFINCFNGLVDYEFNYLASKAYCNGLDFYIDDSMYHKNESVEELKTNIQQKMKINTLIQNYPQLLESCMEMDSSDILRIPFAVDKYGNVQFFEIGGEAPVHALLSGSTGSGKSVLLHSLIMGIVYNYHPDDVEVWAIDYKAVEFNSYIQYRTPHFRVIGYDSSIEFSLSVLDLLYEEYNSRMKKFLEVGVKNIREYRKIKGKHAMSRIVVVIDEFQILTQAVQQYVGNKDYRTVLENLLRLTRAMGISFIFSSQTIASGLSGLTEAARDQISGRLCLKHDSALEIRETLLISSNEDAAIVDSVKNLQRGQGYYKRSLLSKERTDSKKKYEFKEIFVLYINDEIKKKMMLEVNEKIGSDFTPKEEIIVQGGGRIAVTDKVRHPMQKFINGKYTCGDEGVEWYPAAPTTLADYHRIDIQDAAGANMLLVGEDDDLRESIVLHSICGFLMNPDNKVTVSIVDENYSDRKRMINTLSKIHSHQFTMNIGLQESMRCISKLKKIRPVYDGHSIFIWYGFDKLKNEIFLAEQEREEETDIQQEEFTINSKEDMILDLQNFLAEMSGTSQKMEMKQKEEGNILSFEECKNILSKAFEMGPENNIFHFMIFNNNKGLKKSGLVKLQEFENRIGTKMSSEDSFDLFGSSLAINKTDNNTVIYYGGSGTAVPLRPYLLPSDDWIESFNQMIEKY